MAEQADPNPLIEQAQRRAAEIGGQPDPAAGGQGAHPVIDWGGQDAEQAELPEAEVEGEVCGAHIPVEGTGELVTCTLPKGHDDSHYNHDVDAEWVEGDEVLSSAEGDEPEAEPVAEDTNGDPVEKSIREEAGAPNPSTEDELEVTITGPDGTSVRTTLEELESASDRLFEPGTFDDPTLLLKTPDGQHVTSIRVAFTGGEDLVRKLPEHVAFMRDLAIGESVEFTVTGHVGGVSHLEDKAGVKMVAKIVFDEVVEGL